MSFDLSNKRVVVIGLGESGRAAVQLCLELGARVVATDSREAVDGSGALLDRGVELRLGGHDKFAFDEVDLAVVSPGVPPFPALARAEARGLEVIGEVELAYRARAAEVPVLAIGGTNGKSTVTSLVGEVLGAQFSDVFVGGNLGDPYSLAARKPFTFAVLEVSSFQMERVRHFHPRAAVLLNVTDDHLDRYPNFDAYASAKGNMFLRQEPSDLAVVPFGDAVCLREGQRGRARLVTFGPGGDVDAGPDHIVDARDRERYPLSDLRLAGRHNVHNAAAAIALLRDVGVSPDTIRAGLARFEGLAHRMSLVGERRGVRYYDDSKGTNVGAAVTALRGLEERRAVLIAGGRDKQGSYGPLVEALKEKGRAVVVIGEAADAIARAVGDAVPVVYAADMDLAVKTSASLALEGDAVLLSPACSSFDMFRDYKHRGDEFVRAARSLGVAKRGGEGA